MEFDAAILLSLLRHTHTHKMSIGFYTKKKTIASCAAVNKRKLSTHFTYSLLWVLTRVAPSAIEGIGKILKYKYNDYQQVKQEGQRSFLATSILRLRIRLGVWEHYSPRVRIVYVRLYYLFLVLQILHLFVLEFSKVENPRRNMCDLRLVAYSSHGL